MINYGLFLDNFRTDPVSRLKHWQACALATALAVAVGFWVAQGPAGAGVVLAGVGLMGVIPIRRARPTEVLARDVMRVFAATPYPVALATPAGIIAAANPASAGVIAADERLEDIFGAALADCSTSVYRVARAADTAVKGQEAHAQVSITLKDRHWRLHVEPVTDGHQIWRLIPEAGCAAPDLALDGLLASGSSGGAQKAAVRRPVADLGKDRPTLLEDLPIALAQISADGTVRSTNAAARALLGDQSAVGRPLDFLIEGLGKTISERVAETIAGKAQGRAEIARVRAEGAEGFLQVTLNRADHGDTPELLAVISDATELKTLEAQFVQGQKMQAVGQLAGGIAHDFNNLLTAINGHCDLLLLRHLQGDSDHADLMQIRQNANRAAALVRQLLAFSRKQTLRPQTLHLYDTLAELANLLGRLLGEKVALRIENTEDIWPIRADERQLEQVIVNLVVNARDAMPSGGIVNLRTRCVTLDAPLERDRAIVSPGTYAVIEVEDNGIGIPRDKVGKIFEPFYTTKRVGEGTGLGLSTAYGIVKQMDGFIFVDSTLGEGTKFEIYLPAHTDGPAQDEEADGNDAAPTKFRDPTGRGVVLLVEDETPVRAFAARALQMRGYTVLEAESGEAALEILSDRSLRVDLFVSDVIMPGLDGPSWVRQAYLDRTDASTVFISGYSEDMFADGRAEVPRSSYLAKPFTLNDLIERVRDHMDRYVD